MQVYIYVHSFIVESLKKSGALVVKRTEKIPIDEPDVKITETSQLHSNSSVNQSCTSFHPIAKKQAQPLAENHTDNLPKEPVLKKKGKTVSISDDVEEHEIESERSMKDESSTENIHNRPKGTRLTKVKHITSENTKNVNECKNQ